MIEKPTKDEIQEALDKCNVFFGFECDLCPAKEVCKTPKVGD